MAGLPEEPRSAALQIIDGVLPNRRTELPTRPSERYDCALLDLPERLGLRCACCAARPQLMRTPVDGIASVDRSDLRSSSLSPDEWAAVWLRHSVERRDDDFWAFDELNWTVADAPEQAWPVILALVKQASEGDLGAIGAGPLEDLTVKHAATFIDRIEAAALTDPKFNEALSAIWLNSFYQEPGIVARLVAASGGAIEPFVLDHEKAEREENEAIHLPIVMAEGDDISVWSSVEEAELSLEAWIVGVEGHCVWDGHGNVLAVVATDGSDNVRITRAMPASNEANILRDRIASVLKRSWGQDTRHLTLTETIEAFETRRGYDR